MGKSGGEKSAHRLALEGELETWFQWHGVSESGASRAVRLLDASYLLAQSRSSNWNWKGDFGIQERC